MGYVEKTAQKQPKIVLSAGIKIFKISKLENYKSDINETTRKCHEIKRISTFAASKTNSENAKEKGIFYCHP